MLGCFVLACFVLACFVLGCFVLGCSVLGCFVLGCSVAGHFVVGCSMMGHFVIDRFVISCDWCYKAPGGVLKGRRGDGKAHSWWGPKFIMATAEAPHATRLHNVGQRMTRLAVQQPCVRAGSCINHGTVRPRWRPNWWVGRSLDADVQLIVPANPWALTLNLVPKALPDHPFTI
eukprot:351133-Chlamydomonas_euryale.AAC.2